MRSGRFFVLSKALALELAPLLMLLASLPSPTLLRCRMDGLARSTCCCPADADAHRPANPTYRVQSCCDRQAPVGALPAAESTRTSHADEVLGAVAFVLVTAESAPVMIPPSRVHLGHGPPREGPSIVVLKHAFLI